MTPRAIFDQKPSAGGRTERFQTVSELMRGPISASAAGRTISAEAPAKTATVMPA